MKSKIIVFALTMVMLFSLSSFSIVSESAKNAPTDLTPRVDGKKVAIEKILSSKTGQWLLKKIQKRHNKLSIKLATAEKEGDLKKVERIKSKMNPKKLSYGRELLICALIALPLGYLISGNLGIYLMLFGLISLILCPFYW